MRFSSIDIGSNAIRQLIVEIKLDGGWTVLKKHRETIRLGTDVFVDGTIHPTTQKRLILAFKRMARLNKKYNDLIQDYAYLQSQFTDIQAQLATLNERNFQLQQITGRIGELESMLENTKLERDDLKTRLADMESQKYLREFNL